MNPDFPQNERARLEAKLTALLLGELHADEIAALSEAMEKDPELAALYERLKVTVELVREGVVQPKAEEQAPRKLSAERREKLLTSFKTVAPKEFAKPRRVMDWLVPMAACVAIVGVLAAMLLPSLSSAKRKAMPMTYWGDKMAGASSSSQGQIVQNQAATTTRGRRGKYENVTPDVPKEESSVAGGVRVPAPAGETVASTPGFQFGLTPAKTPPVATTPVPIVLPPGQAGDAGVADSFNANQVPLNYAAASDISDALKQLGSQQTNSLALNQHYYRLADAPMKVEDQRLLFGDENINRGGVVAGGVMVTNGIAPGAMAFNSGSFDTKDSYQELSRLGADFENEKITLNYKNVTNGIVDSSGQAPVVGDLSLIGRLFKSNSTVVQNEDFTTASTRDDLSGLRLATNAVVASRSLDEWSFDGITNPASVGYLGVAGANTYGGSTIVNNNGTLTLSDGDHVGGIVQGENRKSEIVLPSATDGASTSGQSSLAQNVERRPARSGGAFGGGGGGFGGGGKSEPLLMPRAQQQASGGKQVELAAAANAPREQAVEPSMSVGAKVAEVGSDNNKELGFDWYLGNYLTNNSSPAVTSGDTRSLKEAPRSTVPSLAAIDRAKPAGEENIQTSQMVQDGKLLFQLGKTDEAELKLNEALARDPDNKGALYYLSLLKQVRIRQVVDARDVTSMNRMVQVEKGWADNDARLKLPVPNPYARTNQIYTSPGRQQIYEKLNTIVFDKVAFPNLQLSEVVRNLAEQTQRRDVDQVGVNFLLNRSKPPASTTPVAGGGVPGFPGGSGVPQTFDPTTGQPIAAPSAAGAEDVDLGAVKVSLDPSIKNLRLKDLLEAIVKSADRPITYRILDYGVEFSFQDASNSQLAEQDKKIQVAQARVDELRKGLGVPDAVADTSNTSELMEAGRLKPLTALRIQKEAEYNQQKTLLEKLKGMDKAALRKTLPSAYTDTQLNELLSEYDLAQQNLIRLKLDYNPDHPKFKSAQAAVDDLNGKIDDRVAGILLGLEAKVAYEKAYLGALQNDIVAAEQAQIHTTNEVLEAFARANDSALPKPAIPPPPPQPEILTRENAFSTFSLNVSDVSFKLAAASLEKGQLPEPASIRSEEFINAFDYRDPDAAPGVPIAFAAERARYPFTHNRELLRFSLKTAAAGRQAGRPLNIVLLLDNSGSMERADRVTIIREALRVLAKQLQASDTFSIVTFARTAQLRVDGVPGSQAAAAAEEIAKLTPEGGTNLGEALDLAYETARHHYLAKGDNRVVLLTDGAANLGDVNPDVLKQKVEAHRQQGVALDCFGIGWEGYNDDLLETLTRNGDGRYGFINTPEAADTDFVAQIAGALHVAAADVKVQVEFNTNRVTSYRQIGYAKHQLTKEQFRDNTVDAAEIAAQEAGNALYTIEINPQGEGSIATVRVRYKVPGTAEYREQAWDVPYTGGAVAMDQASPAMRLASTACGFSEWLATSPYAAEVSTDELLKYLNGVPQVYGADARPAKLEWMIRQAKSISGK